MILQAQRSLPKLPGEGGVEITPFEGGKMRYCKPEDLSTLTTDAASQLNVLGHDGDTLGVNGCQVSVLEKTNQVGLSSLLECQHC